MRKLQTALFFILSSYLAAQTAPAAPATTPKTAQKMPSKSDPQGYSKDMFEDGSKTKSDLGHPATYTPAKGSSDKKIPADLAEIVKAQFGPDFEIAAEKSNG